MNNRFHLQPHTPAAQKVAYALLAGAVVYVCVLLAAEASLSTRVGLLRAWMVLAAGVCAVAVPHVLLPDEDVPMLQRLNVRPRGLLEHQLRQWGRVLGLVLLPGPLLALIDLNGVMVDLGAKLMHLSIGLSIVLAAGLYSFGRYVSLGPASQAWQEGTRGGWDRHLKDNSPGGFAAPNGMVPALLTTPRVFGLALILVLVSAYLEAVVAPGWGWMPSVLWLAWSVLQLKRIARTYDYAFYATNAFYAEVFRSAGGVRVSARVPVPYRGLYWVPPRRRPSVWAGLRQLDRRLPLGRFVGLGLGVLALLFYLDAPAQSVRVCLLLLIAAKNGAVLLLASPSMAPLGLHHVIQPPAAWLVTRFFVNLRWTLLLGFILLLIAFLDPSGLRFAEALLWTGLDVVLAFLTALFVTYGAEFQYRKRFA